MSLQLPLYQNPKKMIQKIFFNTLQIIKKYYTISITKKLKEYSILEIWKQLTDFPVYEISNTGKVRRKFKNHYRELKPITNTKGYYQVRVQMNNVAKTYLVSRLVAIYFIPNPEGKLTVNHKDGNPKNNDISNLEWATSKEQTEHAINTGLQPVFGESSPCHKLTWDDVHFIRNNTHLGYKYLAYKYNVSTGHIGDIIKQRIWKE